MRAVVKAALLFILLLRVHVIFRITCAILRRYTIRGYMPLTHMKPSDDLRFYTIPPLPSDWTPPWELINQLNIFAGQLYLRDYASYLRVCCLLGVPAMKQQWNQWNLSNVHGSDKKDETKSFRLGSSLPFVKVLLAIWTRGLLFAESHMGRILQGQILTERDFEQ